MKRFNTHRGGVQAERIRVVSRTLMILFVLLLTINGTAFAHGVTKYIGGQWFDGARFVSRTVWSVDGVFHSTWDKPADNTIDLQGKFVIPPFADAHSHAFADGMDAKSQINRFLAAGIFYVANPNNTELFTRPIRALVNTAESVDVTYANGGLTSPGGHPVQIYERLAKQIPGWSSAQMDGQAYFTIADARELDSKWPKILEGKPDFIKTYLEYSEEHAKRIASEEFYGKRGLDPALLPLIVKKAHSAGLRVATHVQTAADFRTAVLSGVDMIAHLPLAPLTAEDADLAKKHDVVVVTTTLSHRPTSHVPDIERVHRENLRLLLAAGVRMAIGVDGDHTAVDEAENVRKLTGIEPARLLRIWTGDTARTIFPARKIGCLTDGCESSFLALDGDPTKDFGNVRRISVRVKTGHLLKVVVENAKPSVNEALQRFAHTKGLEGLVAEYRRLRREEPDAWDYSEKHLNDFGYALLRMGERYRAIEIFVLNTETFPKSSNAWDSLGEAYTGAGQKSDAIRCYQRSIELNPKNENGKKMLEKLGSE